MTALKLTKNLTTESSRAINSAQVDVFFDVSNGVV